MRDSPRQGDHVFGWRSVTAFAIFAPSIVWVYQLVRIFCHMTSGTTYLPYLAISTFHFSFYLHQELRIAKV